MQTHKHIPDLISVLRVMEFFLFLFLSLRANLERSYILRGGGGGGSGRDGGDLDNRV